MKLTIEVNDRGFTIITIDGAITIDGGNIVKSNLMSDDNELVKSSMSEIKSLISDKAFQSLQLAIANMDESFEFDDETCSIY